MAGSAYLLAAALRLQRLQQVALQPHLRQFLGGSVDRVCATLTEVEQHSRESKWKRAGRQAAQERGGAMAGCRSSALTISDWHSGSPNRTLCSSSLAWRGRAGAGHVRSECWSLLCLHVGGAVHSLLDDPPCKQASLTTRGS